MRKFPVAPTVCAVKEVFVIPAKAAIQRARHRRSHWRLDSRLRGSDVHPGDTTSHCRSNGIPHSTFRAPHSSGFTLLEVIIALSLSLLLLSAVYGAIQLQYRLTTTGREEMLRAQLGREVLALIETDIRAVVWRVQEPAQEGSESGASESSGGVGSTQGSGQAVDQTTTTSDTQQILTTDDAFSSASSGIFGDSQNLVLHISRPSRGLVYATSEDEAAQARSRSDQASVSYFLADSSSGGLSAAVAQQYDSGPSLLGGIVGLTRLEGDRLMIEQAGAQGGGGVEMLASAAQVELVPEIVSIEFAYWDGLEWLDAWDSLSSGTLPSAIGITLEIDATSEAGDRTRANLVQTSGTAGQTDEAAGPVMVRYVVAVPLAEPYVGEASF